MIPLGERFDEGVAGVIDGHGAPWHVHALGCRAEYLLPARTGRETAREAAAGGDAELDRLHAPLRAEPRDPADAVPQHGADVARDDRGRCRPAHGGLRRRGQ